MSRSTAVHRALDCVDEERDAVADRGDAFETFARRVRNVSTESPPARNRQSTSASPIAMARSTGAQHSTASAPRDRCVTVREAFAETIRPHSTADLGTGESLVETIAAELTEDVAVALATETGWTPTLKTAVLEEVATRRREVDLLRETLRNERSALEAAIDEIDDIVEWLQSTADESLLQADFETLQAKHERLERYRDRLETLTAERQERFTGSTNQYGPDGGRYRTVVTAIYSRLSVRHPILSTATRLDGVCDDCQRTVRTHLTRRV